MTSTEPLLAAEDDYVESHGAPLPAHARSLSGTAQAPARAGAPGGIRIAVFGAFGVGNLGNECTLSALLVNLRRHLPGASVTCICYGPEETTAKYGVAAIPIRSGRLPDPKNRLLRVLAKAAWALPLEFSRWLRILRSIRGRDLLIMTGTGMLSDVGIVPMGLHYDILRWSLAARLCRCKVLFVSVGVGPIRHPLSRIFVKAALHLASFRSYRDRYSQEYLASIHFRDDGDVVPDLAFSLPHVELPVGRSGLQRGRVIGLGVIMHSRRRATGQNDDSLYQEYMAKLAAIAGWLLGQGYTVRLLIGDVVYDSRARTDLIARLEENGVRYDRSQLIDEPAESFEALLAQVAATDFVIASRFHNVLLSLALNKPVIAISFHEKVEALMKAAGLDAYCQDIENIDVERLTAQLAAMEAGESELRQRLGRLTQAWRMELDSQYQTIAMLAGNRKRVPG